MSRYKLQKQLEYIGDEGQEIILRSHAAVVGCGALGGNSASFLTRAGIGEITLIDMDYPEESNLHRQPLFFEHHLIGGISKVDAAAEVLKKMNSGVKINIKKGKLDLKNGEDLIGEPDIILDGTDNLSGRYAINEYALRKKIPWVYGGVSGTVGMVMNIVPGKTPCFSCIFPEFSPDFRPKDPGDIGIIGTLPAMVSSMQVTEAIKLLLKRDDFLKTLQYFNIWSHELTQIKISPDPSCRICGKKQPHRAS
ncbi:MAG: HesA/MoeB/ThiF family protein [Deltaproteobacteria bacterium]|nr:HesA/MoeB/ThiF family protein [Deltaproteobacteria bacterium]